MRDVDAFLAGVDVDAAVFALRSDYRSALFILDALAPLSDPELTAAGDDLTTHLVGLGPNVRIATRLIAASHPSENHA